MNMEAYPLQVSAYHESLRISRPNVYFAGESGELTLTWDRGEQDHPTQPSRGMKIIRVAISHGCSRTHAH